MSIEPSPFLPQTTIAIEKVKIAASAAQPIWKIIKMKRFFINITELQKILIITKLILIFPRKELI